MNKKIYKDPFAIVLLAIIFIVGLYSQTAASLAHTNLTYYVTDVSGLAFISLIIYVVIRPYLRKKQINAKIVVPAILVAGIVILVIIGMLAFGLAMSGG